MYLPADYRNKNIRLWENRFFFNPSQHLVFRLSRPVKGSCYVHPANSEWTIMSLCEGYFRKTILPEVFWKTHFRKTSGRHFFRKKVDFRKNSRKRSKRSVFRNFSGKRVFRKNGLSEIAFVEGHNCPFTICWVSQQFCWVHVATPFMRTLGPSLVALTQSSCSLLSNILRR